MRCEWETAWETDKRGGYLFKLGVRPGKQDTLCGTHRAISSLVTQIRTGGISLRAYPHAIDKPAPINANVAADHRRCDLSSPWNAETR